MACAYIYKSEVSYTLTTFMYTLTTLACTITKLSYTFTNLLLLHSNIPPQTHDALTQAILSLSQKLSNKAEE